MFGDRKLISIMLVENIPQLYKHLQKTLGLIEEIELINTSMSAQESIEAVRELKPEVALVEYNLPDMNGIDLTEILRRDFPGTQVVLISQDNYTDLVLQAVRAGACDFITHEVSVKELTDVLKRAATLSAQDRQRSVFPSLPTTVSPPVSAGNGLGKIISVYGAKGGLGTSTIAANLALSLMGAKNEMRVVLVDGSVQFGDVHLMFNELGQTSIMDLVPRVFDLDPELVENVMLLNRPTGLYIMSAPPRPEFAEKINGENFARILEFLRRQYDYVVVNTSSFISDPVLAALDASEVVVLISSQQINPIRNTRLFLDLWEGLGMDKSRLILTINRFDSDNPITTDKMRERLRHPIAALLPEDNEAAQRADALGKPVLQSGRDSELARAITQLSDLVRKKITEMEEAEIPRMRLYSVA
jgi:pilus assembly protein CpaE